MDAISQYIVALNADNTVSVTVNSQYAAGGVIQHMGYIISGTTKDGVYLEVRDSDTAAGDPNDPLYFLDTPADRADPGRGSSTQQLGLSHTRTFSLANGAATATLLKDPLWYAAKWGGFSALDPKNTVRWR